MKTLILIAACILISAKTKAQQTLSDSIEAAIKTADSLAAVEAQLLSEYDSINSYPDERSMRLGEEYFRDEKYEEAKQIFLTLGEKYELPYFWFLLTMCNYETGEYIGAINHATKCIESLKKEPFLSSDKKIHYKKAYLNDNFECPEFSSTNAYVATSSPDEKFYFVRYSSLSYKKNLIFKIRGICKIAVEDYYGGIEDLKKYHNIGHDSTALTNGLIGYALFKIGKTKEAKSYLDIGIKKGEHNNNKSTLADLYFFRAEYYIKNNLKEKACIDWSKAGENGRLDAYDMIKKYCQ